jgi:hypothetical protein
MIKGDKTEVIPCHNKDFISRQVVLKDRLLKKG